MNYESWRKKTFTLSLQFSIFLPGTIFSVIFVIVTVLLRDHKSLTARGVAAIPWSCLGIPLVLSRGDPNTPRTRKKTTGYLYPGLRLAYPTPCPITLWVILQCIMRRVPPSSVNRQTPVKTLTCLIFQNAGDNDKKFG